MSKELNRLTVFAGKHDSGTYNWSPFVKKLQHRLRFANLSHDITSCSLSKAPKGEIPYAGIFSSSMDGSDSFDFMGDTNFIFKHLIEAGELPDLNGDLGPADAANDLAWRALLEDRLYFI